MLKPMSNPTPVPALVTGLNDTASIWWRSSQKRASRMISPNERPGFFSTRTMKGESAMVALLSYALRREQRALSWCRVSEEGTNIVLYRTIIRMTRGFLGIRQIPARMAAVFRAIGARYRESRLVVDCAGSQIGGLAASKRGNSPLGLHQDTPLLSLSAAFAPVGSSCWCGPCASPLPSEGFEQAQRRKLVSY